jgi:hypothetical protein
MLIFVSTLFIKVNLENVMTTVIGRIIIDNYCYYCHSATIVDYFIKKALKEDVELKPYKLMLLVYKAYCWNLVFNKTCLFKDPIEALGFKPNNS